MTRKPLTAMLTLVAALAVTVPVAGCGSSGGSSSATPTTSSPAAPTTTSTSSSGTTGRKHKSKPAY